MPLIYANTASFNGNDLASVPGLTILSSDAYNPADRKLAMNAIARRDKSKTNSAFYDKKTIEIKVGIARATRDLAEVSFDTLMGLVQGIEKDLIVRQSGGLRKYTSTLSDTVIKTDGGSYFEASLNFETSDHFGYDINQTLLTQISGFTSGQKTTQISVEGSAPWQVPVITLTYTAVTGGSSGAVLIGNDATGQQISISNGFSAGDVIEIDALNQTVKLNGTEFAFSGAIPEWSPGTGFISYHDTFSSRTFSLRMTYYRRFI